MSPDVRLESPRTAWQVEEMARRWPPTPRLWVLLPAVLGALLLVFGAGSGTGLARAAGEDVEDILSGFEEEDDTFRVDESDTGAPGAGRRRWWDLTGSASLGSSINYLDHHSAAGTDYTGVQKLRTRLNLQLDLDLPRGWKARLGGYGFYDFAYRIYGRDQYTREVLDEYEWEVDSQEMYVQGRPADALDVKIGRQIVNWGRSDTLRVLDVLNPLDNREPGLADIEDLRLPVTMGRVSYYWGAWAFTGIAIPEIRFDKLPPYGSDFLPFAMRVEVPPERVPSTFSDDSEWAASAMGIFHGWDISFHFARYWEDMAHTAPTMPTLENPIGLVQEHSRLTLVGSGGNYTLGSWLLKGEIAYIDGADYAVGSMAETEFGLIPLQDSTVRTSRVDVMGGVEYYGLTDTTVALEIVDRHVNGFESRMRLFGGRQDAVETALRVSADFLHARLHTTVLVVVFGEYAQDGAVERLSAEYELRDALLVGGGLLLFQNGDPIEFSQIDKNDRVFVEIKYSF